MLSQSTFLRGWCLWNQKCPPNSNPLFQVSSFHSRDLDNTWHSEKNPLVSKTIRNHTQLQVRLSSGRYKNIWVLGICHAVCLNKIIISRNTTWFHWVQFVLVLHLITFGFKIRKPSLKTEEVFKTVLFVLSSLLSMSMEAWNLQWYEENIV